MGAATPFLVGDRVVVLNPFRLPQVEEVRHVGIVERITTTAEGYVTLYWISGLAVARTAPVLRHAVDDSHLGVADGPRTLTEHWAAQDEAERVEREWL